ncbi:MAG: spore coat protein U domain-containing protein [Luteimonas sp.]|nr:spore coat protein U domain-containing protein [Luteimonas sp.]
MTAIRQPTIVWLLVIGGCLLAPQAQAATTCTSTSTDLNFGPVNGTTAINGQATITIRCNTTGLTAISSVRVRMCLHLGDGSNGIGFFNPRRMTNAQGDPMNFQLYRNSAHTQIWGSTSIPAIPTPLLLDFEYSTGIFTGSGETSAVIHGQVPVQSGLSAGNFTNPFIDNHTRLDYRAAEGLILFPPAYPASCTSGGISGGTIRFPFTVRANVPNRCTIAAASDLDFGNTPGFITTDHDRTSTISLSCTNRTAWNVALDNGQNAIGNVRRMRLGATSQYVAYELYRNPGRTQRWGATIGSDTLTGTGNGSTQNQTVFGRVAAPQTVPAGEYRDVVTVTVTY